MTIDEPSAIGPASSAVMAGLVPAIHASSVASSCKAWMPATSAGMTEGGVALHHHAGALPGQGDRKTGAAERTGRNR